MSLCAFTLLQLPIVSHPLNFSTWLHNFPSHGFKKKKKGSSSIGKYCKKAHVFMYQTVTSILIILEMYLN